MAAFGSLRSLFEKSLPDNPTLMESLSWNPIKAVKPPDDAAFTEIFGELHFEERRPPAGGDPSFASISSAGVHPARPPATSTSSWPPALDRSPLFDGKKENFGGNREEPLMGSSPATCVGAVRKPGDSGDCFPSLDSLLAVHSDQYMDSLRGKGHYSPKGHAESLQLCTEGLGFESSYDVEDSRTESGREGCWQKKETAAAGGSPARSPPEGCNGCPRTCSERRPRERAEFPPPISCIGNRGKPWVRLRSFKEGGRFVLREVRLPTQELLHAFRKDGRLKLHFVQPDEEIEQEEEVEEQEEEEEGEEEEGEGSDQEGAAATMEEDGAEEGGEDYKV